MTLREFSKLSVLAGVFKNLKTPFTCGRRPKLIEKSFIFKSTRVHLDIPWVLFLNVVSSHVLFGSLIVVFKNSEPPSDLFLFLLFVYYRIFCFWCSGRTITASHCNLSAVSYIFSGHSSFSDTVHPLTHPFSFACPIPAQ